MSWPFALVMTWRELPQVGTKYCLPLRTLILIGVDTWTVPVRKRRIRSIFPYFRESVSRRKTQCLTHRRRAKEETTEDFESALKLRKNGHLSSEKTTPEIGSLFDLHKASPKVFR